MKICVYGAGAVGGSIAAGLARTGAEVSVIARAANLAAIRAHGLRVRAPAWGEIATARVRAEETPSALGPQDCVIVAVKGHSLREVARDIGPLLGPRTSVVTALNGVPWWFPHGLEHPVVASGRLDCLDPEGALALALPVERIVGCVVYMAASTPEPGVVSQNGGRKLVLGRPGGRNDEVPGALARLLADGGFEAQVSPFIQKECWLKLLGNICFNPASALTLASSVRMIDDPALRGFLVRLMREVIAIGLAIGIDVAIDPEQRIEMARGMGQGKTSMLQDLEAGKALEIDGLLTATLELARKSGVDAPFTEGLLGLARVRARVTGQYAG